MDFDALPVCDLESPDCDDDVEYVRVDAYVSELLTVNDVEGVGVVDIVALCDLLHVCVPDDRVTEREGVGDSMIENDVESDEDSVADGDADADALPLQDAVVDATMDTVPE